jgi:hypothetical protein
MPRIVEDPTLAGCPGFEGAEWVFLRQPVIDAHVGDAPLAIEDATQRMKEAWTQENQRKIAAWNTQLEQDRVEQEERYRLAREKPFSMPSAGERPRSNAGRQKRKPKLGTFVPQRPVSESTAPRPAPYALSKINNLEYIELDYFAARGCREAFADTSKSVSHDTLAFTQIEDTIAIRPLAALRPSRHIGNYEDLSWVEPRARCCTS